MSEYTPGPWEVDRLWLVATGSRHHNLARLYPLVTPAEWEANARLIAAAPDLLNALISLIAAVTEQPSDEDDVGYVETMRDVAFEGARAAIAKALGQEATE